LVAARHHAVVNNTDTFAISDERPVEKPAFFFGPINDKKVIATHLTHTLSFRIRGLTEAGDILSDSGIDNTDVVHISRRMRMVDEQIARRGIRDIRVLNAMRTVPRHLFVPRELQARAYEDGPLSIGEQQTISQPYVVASMTEELDLPPDAKVLEIGTGSGYQTAVLAEIAGTVCSIEILPSLLVKATSLLAQLNYANTKTVLGDGARGWRAESPFDGIIVTAAAARIPDALTYQLSESGVMVMPLKKKGQDEQELIRIRKKSGGIEVDSLYSVRFVPMRGEVED